MATCFKVTLSMVVNNAYLWLEKYANKSETSQVVLVKIQIQLEAVGVAFEEERWLDILDHINTRSEGWEDVKAIWQKVKASGVYLCNPLPTCQTCEYPCRMTNRRPQGLAPSSGLGLCCLPWIVFNKGLVTGHG